MWKRHQKVSLYQLLLLFNIYLPPQGMHLLLIFTFLRNIPPMIVPNFIHSNILLLIQVRISLFRHLVLQKIYKYILNTTQKIKYGQLHTIEKHTRLYNLRIPYNNQQFTFFWGESEIAAHPYQPPLSNLKTQANKNLSIYSAHLQIGRVTSYSPPNLDKPHHLFPHPPDSSLPCDILQLSNPGLYNRPQPNFSLGLLLHLHPLFNFYNR